MPTSSEVPAERGRPSPRPPLGRSLSALLAEGGVDGSRPAYRLLPLTRLRPAAGQPRRHFRPEALDELAASIAAQGVLQPLVVRRAGQDFEIVAGERRWRAAARAGVAEVPAVVHELCDARAMQVALVENIQRQDLEPLEEAQAFARLIEDHQLSHEQVAEAVGKSRAAVSNGLRLLQLPVGVRQLLDEGRLSAGHARAVMSLRDPGKMLAFARRLADQDVSVRQAEAQARRLAAKPSPRRRSAVSADQQALQERLQRCLGARVEVVQRRGRGHLRLHFTDLDGLEALCDRLLGSAS